MRLPILLAGCILAGPVIASDTMSIFVRQHYSQVFMAALAGSQCLEIAEAIQAEAAGHEYCEQFLTRFDQLINDDIAVDYLELYTIDEQNNNIDEADKVFSEFNLLIVTLRVTHDEILVIFDT